MLGLRSISMAALLLCATLLPSSLQAATVAVRRTEGAVRGFLVLRTLDGEIIANGDLIQVARGGRVTNQLIFHFKDGSLHHETAVFSQRGTFRLISDHLVQKGPAFKHPVDISIDAATGQFTVHYTEDDGKETIVDEHVDLPDDVSNGMVLTLLKNVSADAPATLSLVAATPKPRVVKLEIHSLGEEPFSTGTANRKAVHYVVKIEIGGVAGLLAPLVGKQPPDTHVWIMGGEVPAFVKSEGPLYLGGPTWRIELTSPVWPRTADANSSGGKDSGKSKR